MSRLHSETFACAHCGAPLEMGIVASINADRRPDLRQAVLDDSYQRGRCESCGKGFRLDPDLTYLDAGRGQWLLVRPAEHLDEWPLTEALARQAFAIVGGMRTATTRPRAVSTSPALKETSTITFRSPISTALPVSSSSCPAGVGFL